MFETITNYINTWNTTKTERQKLQSIFLVSGSFIVILSGLLTFLNYTLGYTLVSVGVVLLGVYVINGVVWNFVSSAFLSRLSTKAKKK